MRIFLTWLVSAALLGSGCTSTPPEAGELSSLIGRDLGRLHASHSSLVRQRFDVLRARAEIFVDDVYRPYILRTTMEDLDLINEIQAAARGDGDLDSLDVMEIYVEEALSRIEAFRRSLLAPIRDQEEALLTELDETYAALRDANAVITAHLASERRLRGARSEAFAQLGVPEDFEERLATGLSSFSNRVDELLLEASDAEETLDELPARVRDLRERF